MLQPLDISATWITASTDVFLWCVFLLVLVLYVFFGWGLKFHCIHHYPMISYWTYFLWKFLEWKAIVSFQNLQGDVRTTQRLQVSLWVASSFQVISRFPAPRSLPQTKVMQSPQESEAENGSLQQWFSKIPAYSTVIWWSFPIWSSHLTSTLFCHNCAMA